MLLAISFSLVAAIFLYFGILFLVISLLVSGGDLKMLLTIGLAFTGHFTALIDSTDGTLSVMFVSPKS